MPPAGPLRGAQILIFESFEFIFLIKTASQSGICLKFPDSLLRSWKFAAIPIKYCPSGNPKPVNSADSALRACRIP